MNNSSVGHAVKNRNGSVIGFNGLGVIAAFDSRIYFLDLSTYHGSERCIVATTNFALFCTLAGLWRISQLELLIALDLCFLVGYFVKFD